MQLHVLAKIYDIGMFTMLLGPSCFSLLIVSSMTVQISINPFYGENGSMFGVGEVMVMLVIRTHLAGDTSPGAE